MIISRPQMSIKLCPLILNNYKRKNMNYTSKTPLIQPSNSGLLVICAYFPHTTLPDWVTNPNSLTFTSMIVPFVMTPSDVNNDDDGFFLTPRISKQKVVFSSGCVICAFLNLNPVGRMNRSYLGAFRV
mmetsp:Transcript_22621/g.30992  ORF Transcript_22621/g.30992 Transcript_22621/m.30992 type:complete len:128 (+) Transcript_22621:710-1093(+)